MRPSDENQHRSKRPSLFSSSTRDAAEDNILAKLEYGGAALGDASGHRRYALMGGAGILIVALIATLAWLTRNNLATRRALPPPNVSMVEVAPPAAPSVLAEAAVPAAALIVEAPAAAPALVTLPQAAPSASASAAPARAASLSKVAAFKKAKSPTPARHVAKAAPAPARKTPALAPARTEPADRDVAILSVILAQSERHAAERGQACATGRSEQCRKAGRP